MVAYQCKNIVIVERAKCNKNEHDAENKANVTDAVNDKSFTRSVGILHLIKPKTNQQIRTQADQFPANKHQQIIATHHQHQHRGDKQIKVNKVTIGTWVAMNIANAIQMNECAHTGNN